MPGVRDKVNTNNLVNRILHMINRLRFMIIILFVISLLTGCNDNTTWIWDSAKTKAAKRAKIDEENKKKQEWIHRLVDNTSYITDDEQNALLSVKYSVNENVVIKILKEYEEKSQKLHTYNISNLVEERNEDSQNITDTKKNPYSELLITISHNNDITTDIIASIIMDYKWLNSINNE